MLNRLVRRWLMPALALLFVGTAIPAHAAWKIEQVRWRHLGRGDLGFSENGNPTQTSNPVFPRGSDTTAVSAAPARVDTTAEWSMLDCDNMTIGAMGGVAEDSLASAYLVCQADSTVASTIDFKNTTFTFQVNYGDNSTGWVTTGTALAHNFTAGAKIAHNPIFSRSIIDKDAAAEVGGVTTSSANGIFAPRMRCLVTWGTAAAVPTATLYIKKFVTQQTITRTGPAAGSFGVVK